MDDNKTLTLKGVPMYIVALFESVTQMLPTLILWLTFLYGLIQLILVCKQYCKETKGAKIETD